jgi:primosomal replication protein N''
LIRLCPKCLTERSPHELFCEGRVGESECGWDLTSVPLRAAGLANPVELDQPDRPTTLLCPNDHPVNAGDLICGVCGVDLDTTTTPAEPGVEAITVIDGWQLQQPLPSDSKVEERYLAVNDNGDQAVLRLYTHGSEPDPSVYEVLKLLSTDHIPKIIATGRWDDHAYEVNEELAGGTLAELGLLPNDLAMFARVVEELGKCLHSFSEHGLRHRDLRPGAILVRQKDPLDLVITGFGSARLSDFDLDIVSPLETTRYSAPEAIAGGVAAASDWWSLGMILLEQITRGKCFEGVNEQAFLIHVITNGPSLPDYIEPRFGQLLRGLLARDRRERWSWDEVKRWLAGEDVPLPKSAAEESSPSAGQGIELGGRSHHNPKAFALAAADSLNWNEAKDRLLKGAVVTWAEEANVDPRILGNLRQLRLLENLADDFRLALALKILNPSMPLVCRGDIVTPGWLLDHADEGYELITGPAPDFLKRQDAEIWLSRMKLRTANVRERARNLEVMLDEESLRVHLLSTSQSRLEQMWNDKRRILPESDHPALSAILERRQISEEDLILLLSAAVGQFQTSETIVAEATEIASEAGCTGFDPDEATTNLLLPRRELYRKLDKRIKGFARCGLTRIDEWVDQFRLEHRIPVARALVALSVPPERWLEPPKQAYVATLLDFFAKRVTVAVQRGPLSRMTIGKTTARVDLTELGSTRLPSAALLEQLLVRSDRELKLDPAVFTENAALERRLRSLYSHAVLYRRDTGVDGLYMGFPFLLIRTAAKMVPRISPVLLWPVRLKPEIGSRGNVSLSFDREREEIRLNPAFNVLLGNESAESWKDISKELLGRASLSLGDLMDGLGALANSQGTKLVPLPNKDVQVRIGEPQLVCSAVLFHLAYMGQAVVEDLRQLKGKPPAGTGLETLLRVSTPPVREETPEVRELDRFFTADSDPSQESAVLEARKAPGLVVDGPPGTGKSQTIVNMIADAIGSKRSLLVVCQKQAALDVVHKRLDAEGLADRIMMITDENRDRERTLKLVREQLETLHRSAQSGAQAWRINRAQVSARIESLEGELDAHHAALHELDPVTGSTYRFILSELIALESEARAPVNAPGLRPHFSKLDPETVATLQETCAPLARQWLPSQFEDSPLGDLKGFTPDAAAINDFKTDFDTFVAAETERQRVLAQTTAALSLPDPQSTREWLATHTESFRTLSPIQRHRLVEWLPLFPREAAKGQKALAELASIRQGVENIVLPEPDKQNQTVAISLSELELSSWLELAGEFARPASFFAKLSPRRWFRSRRLQTFFRERSLGELNNAAAFVVAANYEIAVRPGRTRLAALAGSLNVVTENLDHYLRSTLLGVVQRIENELSLVRDLAQRLHSCPLESSAIDAVDDATEEAFERFVDRAQQGLRRHEARLSSLASLHKLEAWFNDAWIASARNAIESERSNELAMSSISRVLPTLEPYLRFRRRASSLSPLALTVFRVFRGIESSLASVALTELEHEVRRTIERESRLAWKTRLEDSNPLLLLEAAELEGKVKALSAADEQMRKANQRLLVEGIDMSRVSSPRAWEEITRLRGQRSRRLREFLERGAELGLMELRPVWLMNPDVASRILPLKPGLFDTVIYDEASQIPVEFALPTLFRAKIAVVSGDEKQMPPTAFFSSRVENDEADVYEGDETEEGLTDQELAQLSESRDRREIKDYTNLLELAKDSLPSTTLQIHYRSAFRELISFSNASFYEGRLHVPVRHPDDVVRHERPIEVIRIDGIYSNQTNAAEASKVADILASLWDRPFEMRKSVGVVTFNRKQADLIEEVLEDRAVGDASFRNALSKERERKERGEDMGFFVKNVENVQGDERDIIIFSSTFGKNAQGTFRRNFGVLGQTGGERRLNVAVTRAREKVFLITSMPFNEISDLLNTHRPAETPRDFLQGYFEYSRAISSGELETARTFLDRLPPRKRSFFGHDHANGDQDGFQQAVRNFIESSGWTAADLRDGSPFGADIGIKDPSTGLYAIAIECDSPRDKLLARARAREIWRPSVLRKSIPQIHRVSSHRWYHDPHDERERLRVAIETALPGRST